eukprot:XP_015576745.1 uncharacterized protein LOC8265460 [Ricinus communis]
MAPRTALVLLSVCCLSLIHIGAEGRKLSEEEHQELEKQFKIYNKSGVKTILTKYGDAYKCVHFHEQAAFHHPSLNNHTFHFQMKPLSYPKDKKKKETRTLIKLAKSTWVNGKGCPRGTVPIRKLTKEEFIETKLATETYASKSGFLTAQDLGASRLDLLSAQDPGVHYAVVHTKADGPYNGGGMVSSVYNPQVVGSQYSSARLKIQNGPESIEVGWMVNPSLNKDNRTRLYVYTNAGESHCFNAHCPGIITVRPDIPLDFILEPTSTRGSSGKRYVEQFFIYKDAANGNWFLEIGNGFVIGFWPQTRFTTLANSANYVEWGGVVSSPPDVPSPPMGSGNSRLFADTAQDAFCSAITVVNKDHQIVDASDTQKFTDIGDVYHVKDIGFYNNHFRHIFFFGGLGGYTGN